MTTKMMSLILTVCVLLAILDSTSVVAVQKKFRRLSKAVNKLRHKKCCARIKCYYPQLCIKESTNVNKAGCKCIRADMDGLNKPQ